MENAYAAALWKIVEKGTTPQAAVRALYEKLALEGRVSLLPRIARAFERLAARNRARTGVTLAVADLSQEGNISIAAAATGIDLTHALIKEDPTLIGGWRIEAPETLIDASYKKDLLAIYRSATNF